MRIRVLSLHSKTLFYRCEPRSNSYEGWLPTIGMQRYRRAEDLAPNTIHSLTSYLRMAFCDWVYISVDAVADTSFSFGKVWGMVFDDLAAPSTFVDILNMNLPLCRVELALRKCLGPFVSS